MCNVKHEQFDIILRDNTINILNAFSIVLQKILGEEK